MPGDFIEDPEDENGEEIEVETSAISKLDKWKGIYHERILSIAKILAMSLWIQ